MKSWKTTLAGVGMILAAIVFVIANLSGHDITGPGDWAGAIAALTGGVGLITARDNDKSSEKAGAK